MPPAIIRKTPRLFITFLLSLSPAWPPDLSRTSVIAKLECNVLEGRPHDFDAAQVARPDAEVFGQPQGVVAGFKRRRAALGHRVEAHDRHCDGIRVYGIGSRHEDARADRHGRAGPRKLRAGDTFDAFNNFETGRDSSR